MRLRRAAVAAAAAAGAPFAATSAYNLLLLAAAWPILRGAEPRSPGAPELPVTVLIPAHDEEEIIGRTLRSLADAAFPPELLRTIVIADNCTDATADVARAAGVAVWERHDATARGKGRALSWALDRLFDEPDQRGFILFIDADCAVSPHLLHEVEATLRGGAAALQTAHIVSNPEDSPVAALRYAGFRLVMTVRPTGLAALGLSAGLYGTGMGFRRDVLREISWRSYSITEDLEQHLNLVSRGHRVVALPHSIVASPAPLTHADAESQQFRWEGGRSQLATRTAPAVALRGLKRRDPVLTMAAVDLMVPPQSLHAAGNVAMLGTALALRSRGLAAAALLSIAAQGAYVAGGLVATRAPAPVWRAMLEAPVLVARKLGVLGRVAAGGTPDEFVRTRRETPGEDAVPAGDRKLPA